MEDRLNLLLEDDRLIANLRGAVALSHFFLRERVRPGDRVVDATCGNGQDTLFLARLVGGRGIVWSFDVQWEALVRARELLSGEGLDGRVEFVHSGHERLSENIRGPLQAVVFNLGFLPGGDRTIRTEAGSSVAALEQAAEALGPGGIITISTYTGHPGGSEEGAAVEEWASSLRPDRFNVWRNRQRNALNLPLTWCL